MAKKAVQPQFVEIEQPFENGPPAVHCPVCGKSIAGDRKERVKPSHCCHLVFIFDGGTGGFGYMSADFRKRVDSMDLDKHQDDSFQEFLKNAGYGNQLLAMQITYGISGRNAAWHTDVYGFDFSVPVKDGKKKK
ncbi:MAG: hypothetical protein PHW04_12870 [Candidatus Wallbacteria bacterium]|nr:hypothetical protein [Candidatus Wallbacteria bacterium]